jgi:hypothetical protein
MASGKWKLSIVGTHNLKRGTEDWIIFMGFLSVQLIIS